MPINQKKQSFVYYDPDPSLDDKVKLYDGTTAAFKDTVRLMYGRYALAKDKQLVKDYITDEYILKAESKIIINGFKEDAVDKDNVLYNHQENKSYYAILYDNSFHEYYVKHDTIPLKYYTEDMNSGIFYHTSISKEKYIAAGKCFIYRKTRNSYFSPTGDLKKDYLLGLKSPTFRLTEGKRYTFGVELETIKGYLPSYLDLSLNYDAVHDGSLRENGNEPVGGEYVTGKLIGDMGFAQLKRLCIELTNRCKVNKLCGFHVHLGDFNFTNENLILLYKVYYLLEDEIFSMLPSARGNNEYCRRLPSLETCLKELKLCDIADAYSRAQFVENAYLELFNFVSSSELKGGILMGIDFNKSTEHPLGKKCNYNHKASRYCWLNFVPALFNTRNDKSAKTLEIRNHSGTTNYRKVKNWVLMHMAIMSYVENFQNELLLRNSLTLNEVISKTFPKRSSMILQYIDERKQTFKDRTKNGALTAELNDYTEINEDESLTLTNL